MNPGQQQSGPNLERTYEAQDWAASKLFAKQIKIHPKRVKGTFRTLKWWWLAALLGIYYLTPWIRWDRGPSAPDQAVLLDIPARKFYFFGLEIWPQEIFLLTGILFICAMGLFFVTSLFGRVWCAWACPQTVWTDLFVWVERRIEGDRNARIKLDKAPWTFGKIGKRVIKHFIWIVIAMATGGAWVFYYADAPTLMQGLLTFSAPTPAYIAIGILTFTTYLLAGHAREQVCVYMCPYSRFQSVMLDKESAIITYRADRGEPRGKHKRGTTWEGRGDCIDCTQCVSVCPTGIDIREGVQIECINCGLCADACDRVMDLVGRPRGLIALDSTANVERRQRGEPSRLRIFRPRAFVYTGVLSIAVAAMIYGLATRDFIEMNIIKDRQPAFVPLANGDVRNTFTVRVLNKHHADKTFAFTIEGLDPSAYWQAGAEGAPVTFNVGPDRIGAFRVFVRLDPDTLDAARVPLDFVIRDGDTGEEIREGTVFIGPGGDG